MTVRTLTDEDIRAEAARQVEADEPMQHHFEPGSREAEIFEAEFRFFDSLRWLP